MTNLLFDPPFEEFRGNIRTSSIAHGKRVVDFLFAIIELFASFYGCDVVSRYWSKSALFRWGGSL